MSDINGTENELIIEWIRTPEQVLKLEEFAKKTNHEFYINFSIHKVFVVKKKLSGKWIGWVKVPSAPTLQVAIDEEASPRETRELIRMVGGWAKIQHGEAIFAVPLESKNFTYEVLQRLGAYPMHSALYISDGLV